MNVQSVVSAFDMDVCKIGFLLRKYCGRYLLDYDVPEVVDDAIMKKKMKVLRQKSIQRTEDRVKKYERRGFRFDGYTWNGI